MTLLVLLKAVYDLGLYFTVGALVANALDISTFTVLIGILICAVSYTATFPLRNRGFARFLPMAGLALLRLLELPKWGYLLFLPVAIYHFRLVYCRLYLPTWDQQSSHFRKYVFTSAFLLAVTGLVTMMGPPVITIAVMMLITITCSVLLTRTLRHDPEVYVQPTFQLLNASILSGVLFAAAFFSSELFLRFAKTVLGFVYNNIICPILLVVCQILAYILFRLLSLFAFEGNMEMPQLTMGDFALFGEDEIITDTAAETTANPILRVVLIIIGAVIVSLILWKLFGYLSKSTGKATRPGARHTEHEALPIEKRERGLFGGLTPTERVRAQYRAYLKLCRGAGTRLMDSDTSQDVLNKTPSNDAARELRAIYLRARYNMQADKSDVERATALVKQIRKGES